MTGQYSMTTETGNCGAMEVSKRQVTSIASHQQCDRILMATGSNTTPRRNAGEALNQEDDQMIFIVMEEQWQDRFMN